MKPIARIAVSICMIKLLGYIAFGLFLAFMVRYFYFKPMMGFGETAPDFKIDDIHGSPIELSNFSGKYLLLDFWGSWCAPCRAENPIMVMLYDRYKSSQFKTASGIDFMSVALERNKEQALQAIQNDGLNWPKQVIQEERMSSSMALLYGVKEIPSKFLISPNGKILLVNPDFKELDDYLAKELLKN
ncbi:MAG: TlpA family protein disulfide reductase [Saprospiraceae bacterium]|nr:TlpA family protein disulfide reductase [Saprospiraceae bacterium]